MTELCEIPLERLRSPDDDYEEFYYHWVDVRQTYWLRRPGLVDKLIAAIETSNPEVAHSVPRDLLQRLLYPPINLFCNFVRKNEEGFGPALAEALALSLSTRVAAIQGQARRAAPAVLLRRTHRSTHRS
ncbi:immunity 49 family protein [Streptomyces sp. NPDC051364]|uniref:immunity 49 family protein n=1 Tax=Streptomyces sp. NPDC051364 TaxID=3155799 RepID=UPI003421021B